MNQDPDETNNGPSGTVQTAVAKPVAKNSRRLAPVIIVSAIVLVLIVGISALLFWPRPAGKPVPAPRSVSFEETPNQQPSIAGEQKLTLTPEQLRSAPLSMNIIVIICALLSW
jgi:hypothetical protein